MAKPIKATPTLVGDEANRFIERMIFVENAKITPRQREEARTIKANMEMLTIC